MIFLIIFLFFFLTNHVNSHHKIYSPVVEEGRHSLEWRGHLDVDDRDSKNKAHHHVLETEYSWTNFWQSEIELHLSDKEETPFDWEKTEFQNQLQILDFNNFNAALYFSYNFVSEGEEADEIEYKYLNQFTNRHLSLISNFIFEKQVGATATGSTTFSLSNSLMYKDLFIKDFDVGFFGFSDLGNITKFNTLSEQKHQYGLQFESEFELSSIEYEFSFGYLHGLTDSTANHTLVWNIEVELD